MSDAPPPPDGGPEDGGAIYGGRYELHRKLARGGMADVFLARDTLLDRPVALKVLFPEFATDPAFVERFRREAQAAANLNHPNIVGVYDWGGQDSTYYIVMELVEGRTLSQIVRDEGALQPERAADVAIDIAGALGFAHRNGVIHRDVKPGNVLISPMGQVKVTDFGIARAVSTQENLTQTGTVMGTATYFSPEQARGEQVDPRSDVYSLGVVLYELLVGEPPFRADSPVAVAYMHVQETPVLPSARQASVPAALEAVTMKALAKNPANRYASADDLAADLRRYREGRPVEAERVLPPDDATVSVSAIGPMTQATTRVTDRPDSTRIQRTTADDAIPYPETRTRSAAFVTVLALVILALLGGLAYAGYLLLGEEGEQLVVPDVIGRTAVEAERILTDAGFAVSQEQDAESGAAEGTVVSQTPEQSSEAEEGSTVTITVASTAPPVAVPSLVGRRQAEAEKLLRDAGLTPAVETEPDDSQAGTVLDQTPAAGTKLPKGSAVRLTVSSGKDEVTVPDVVGETCGRAQALLFDVGLFGACDPDTAVVTRQSPAAGERTERRGEVQLTAQQPTTTTSSTTSTSTVTLLPTSTSSTSTSTSSTSTTSTTR